MKFTEIPQSKQDVLGFFEAVALAGLNSNFHRGEYKPFRLSAKTQRFFFGCVPFGKKKISVDGNAVEVTKKVAFGQDWSTVQMFWSQFDKAWTQGDGRLWSHENAFDI